MEIARIYLLLVPAALITLFAGLAVSSMLFQITAIVIRDWRAGNSDFMLALGVLVLVQCAFAEFVLGIILAALWVAA